jgi:hypothetical protein
MRAGLYRSRAIIIFPVHYLYSTVATTILLACRQIVSLDDSGGMGVYVLEIFLDVQGRVDQELTFDSCG